MLLEHLKVIIMDYKRQMIKIVVTRQETDEEYLARICNESHAELTKAFADVNCLNFGGRMTADGCKSCKLYARNTVEDFENLGKKYPEKCEMRLALNYLAAVRHLIVTGKP